MVRDAFRPEDRTRFVLARCYTIVIMFSLKGNYIISLPLDVLRIAIPCSSISSSCSSLTFYVCWRLRINYAQTTTLHSLQRATTSSLR